MVVDDDGGERAYITPYELHSLPGTLDLGAQVATLGRCAQETTGQPRRLARGLHELQLCMMTHDDSLPKPSKVHGRLHQIQNGSLVGGSSRGRLVRKWKVRQTCRPPSV